MWWERGERQPLPHFYPAIIAYLGCEPWPEPETLAHALRAERLRRGLDLFAAARQMGVDEGTLGRWERCERKPTSRTLPVIDAFLGITAAAAFADDVRLSTNSRATTHLPSHHDT